MWKAIQNRDAENRKKYGLEKCLKIHYVRISKEHTQGMIHWGNLNYNDQISVWSSFFSG